MTEVGRAMALASIKDGQLVAFFIFRTEQERRFGSIEEELRHAYKGAGWHVGRVLARIPHARSVHFDDVAQIICPRCVKYETRMRPFVEKAQKSAKRAASLFMPNAQLHLVLRDIGLRLASSQLLAKTLRPLFVRGGDRL